MPKNAKTRGGGSSKASSSTEGSITASSVNTLRKSSRAVLATFVVDAFASLGIPYDVKVEQKNNKQALYQKELFNCYLNEIEAEYNKFENSGRKTPKQIADKIQVDARTKLAKHDVKNGSIKMTDVDMSVFSECFQDVLIKAITIYIKYRDDYVKLEKQKKETSREKLREAIKRKRADRR